MRGQAFLGVAYRAGTSGRAPHESLPATEADALRRGGRSPWRVFLDAWGTLAAWRAGSIAQLNGRIDLSERPIELNGH